MVIAGQARATPPLQVITTLDALLQAKGALEHCKLRRKGTFLARARALLSMIGRRRETSPKEP